MLMQKYNASICIFAAKKCSYFVDVLCEVTSTLYFWIVFISAMLFLSTQ